MLTPANKAFIEAVIFLFSGSDITWKCFRV